MKTSVKKNITLVHRKYCNIGTNIQLIDGVLQQYNETLHTNQFCFKPFLIAWRNRLKERDYCRIYCPYYFIQPILFQNNWNWLLLRIGLQALVTIWFCLLEFILNYCGRELKTARLILSHVNFKRPGLPKS